MTIWLAKASEDSDKDYMTKLTESGYDVKHIAVLDFKFINQDVLTDALSNPDSHSGIVFTSPRAVQALSIIYKNIPMSKHAEWKKKKIFGIGATTANAIKKEMDFLNVLGQDTHTAKNLFPLIVQETAAFDKPLLIPCSNLKRDELPRLLAGADRDFRSIVAYETHGHPKLKSAIEDLIAKHGLPRYIVFFSPSGVNHISTALKSLNISISTLDCIAIGPTTNSSLTENSFKVVGVCPSPSPEGILHVLKGL